MAWTFVVCDTAGAVVGELGRAGGGQPLGGLGQGAGGISNRSLVFNLNRIPTFGFTARADHPMARYLGPDQVGRTLVKGYDDSTGVKVLRYLGPLIASQKVRNSAGGTLAVTTAGVAWRLGGRLIGKSVAGATFGTTPTSLLDRGEIQARMVEALNSGDATNIYTDAGDTGIRRGTITPSTATYVNWQYTFADKAFTDLTAPLDGPDWEVAPVEPVLDAYGLQLGALNALPVIGVTEPNVLFEYGTGKLNVGEWSDMGDLSALANLIHHLPPGWPQQTTGNVLTVTDAASQAAYTLREALITDAPDLAVDQLRQLLLQENLAIRKVPRRVISFTPITELAGTTQRRVPRLFVDYGIGDVVIFHAREPFPVLDSRGTVIGTTVQTTANLSVRVYKVTLNIDDQGNATPTVVLVDDGS